MQIKWSGRLLAGVFLFTQLFSGILVAAPYELIDLGTLGGDSNYAYAINELNEVTGYSESQVIPDDQIDADNPPPSCNASDGTYAYRDFCNHAYLYSNEEIIDLGAFTVDYSFGVAINDNSTVVGFAVEEVDDGDETTINLTHNIAFISFNGTQIEALPFPEEINGLAENVLHQQHALDISNDRKVVGFSYIHLTNDAEEESSEDRPFLYDYDTDSMTILPVFSDNIERTGSARAINSLSVVVGWAESEDEYNPVHALLWDPASPDISTDIGTLGGYISTAYDINDNNFVVGVSDTSEVYADNESLGFIYDHNNEIMVAIPEFSDADNFVSSAAYAINNNNQVVGKAQITSGFSPKSTAFLYNYSEDTLINLNDMVDCSLNWEVLVAKDINDSGVITGIGTVDDEVHSFMLIPTADTEPTNCTALREQVRDQQDDDADTTGSGSVSILLLLFLGLIAFRRHPYILG